MGAELPGDVTLYSADLVTAGAYDDACADADAVIHAAAQVDPFVVVDPIKDMVEPSTEGVKNILFSVNKWCASACLSLATHGPQEERDCWPL
jgi:nucleoside-diphosphate-sugar epimerase